MKKSKRWDCGSNSDRKDSKPPKLIIEKNKCLDRTVDITALSLG